MRISECIELKEHWVVKQEDKNENEYKFGILDTVRIVDTRCKCEPECASEWCLQSKQLAIHILKMKDFKRLNVFKGEITDEMGRIEGYPLYRQEYCSELCGGGYAEALKNPNWCESGGCGPGVRLRLKLKKGLCVTDKDTVIFIPKVELK